MFNHSPTSIPLLTPLNSQEPTDDSKHNCCLHIKNASDAWWLTNPDITEKVCERYQDIVSNQLNSYRDVTDAIQAKFDGETCNGDDIDDADWKSKCKEYGTFLGWTDERVGAGHNGTCYPIDN